MTETLKTPNPFGFCECGCGRETKIAQHPVKSIGDVYAKRGGEWFRVTSGVTKHINTGGRAYLVFSDKIKMEKIREVEE